MENLNEIIKELNNILVLFGKLGSRKYTEKTLQEKEATVEELLAKAQILKPIHTTAGKAKEIVEAYESILNLGKEIRLLIKEQRDSKSANENTKMPFDIKMATALVAPYSGKEEETESFIDALDLLNVLTEEGDRSTMIRFIKTRITGRAKLSITPDLQTLDAIKAKLRQKFSMKLSSDAILAQLKATQQGSKKLTDYISQIENLTAQLTRAFISENVASGETAENLAEKFARQALVDNVANPETSLILRASNYTKLSDIAAKAIAIDKPVKANVFHFNAQDNKNQGNFKNNFQNNKWRSNNQNQRYDRQNNWFSRNANMSANGSGSQGQNASCRCNRYQSASNWQNNGRRNDQQNRNQTTSNNGNNRQRVYCCSSGECQPPQQDANPSQLGGQITIGESSI